MKINNAVAQTKQGKPLQETKCALCQIGTKIALMRKGKVLKLETLKNFLFSLPEDWQVALDELMEEGFEIRLYQFYFVDIFLPKSNIKPAPYFTIKTREFRCWAEGFTSIGVDNTSANIFKNIIRMYYQKQINND